MAYTIKLAARAVGVSIKTLKRWEAAGRISVDRDEHGYRTFNDADVSVLRDMAGDRARPGQELFGIDMKADSPAALFSLGKGGITTA